MEKDQPNFSFLRGYIILDSDGCQSKENAIFVVDNIKLINRNDIICKCRGGPDKANMKLQTGFGLVYLILFETFLGVYFTSCLQLHLIA